MTTVTEREIKLGSWAGFKLPDLDGVFDGVVAVAARERALHAIYYDTSDLRLARWGVTVRYRTGNAPPPEDPGAQGPGPERPVRAGGPGPERRVTPNRRGAWTVKIPRDSSGDADHALLRGELNYQGASTSVPGPAAALLRGYVRSAALEPVARLKTRRRGIELRDAGGNLLAEVVDDEVSVLDGRRVAARFSEIEVEIADRAPDGLVAAVVARLRQAGAGDADPTPKVIRALGARALEPPEVAPVVLGDDPTMGDVVRAAVAKSVNRLLSHEPGIRIGDEAEDIHQARVGTRRMRSDLRTFRAVTVEEWAAPLSDELRWLGGLLGDVRDADVLLQRLHRQTQDMPATDTPGVRSLLRRLGKERTTAREHLLEAMAGPRYVQLLDRLVNAAHEPQLASEADEPARPALPALVSGPWSNLAKAVRMLPADPPDADLHRVRIRAKRARYAAEAAAPVIGKPATALAQAVAKLQDVLGDHQDAVVAEGWLREAAARAGPARALVAGELIGTQRAEAAARRREWREAWDKASSRKLRAWLE